MDKKKIVFFLIGAVLIGLFFFLDLGRFLTLESLKANRDALRTHYEGHRGAVIALFILIYIVQTSLSLPGAAILSLAGGAVFGVAAGTIAVNIGATAGATLAFLATRYLFRDAVQRRFGKHLEPMNRELERRGFNYLLFLRLVPVFPFFLINLGAGLTRVTLRAFFFGTMIGIIPGSLVYCNAGASLADITSPGEIVSFRVIGSFALLGMFALIPALYGKFKKNEAEP